MDETEAQTNYSLDGILECGDQSLLGVFDGMGGEECGEIASLIAARSAKEFIERESISEDLNELCNIANEKICQFADQHNIVAMGTTAALLLFGEKDISLCNIGDSKIFRFADEQFEQISVDHIAIGLHGRKPPLLQNLGISSSEMIIEPYLATGDYNDGDIYLICSDGLTEEFI